MLATLVADATVQGRPGPKSSGPVRKPATKRSKSLDGSEAKTDVWTHILPNAYTDRLKASAAGPLTPIINMLTGIPGLCDLEARLRGMDQFGDYRQVLTLVPFLHLGLANANPRAGTELVRVANDSIAQVVSKHPERFVGFVSSLPLHDPDQAIRELDRTVTDMGALGVQLEANVNGLPLDDPRFEPLFSRLAELDKPVWIHPARPISASDYPTEKTPRYPLTVMLGWPYETAVCFSRLIFAGYLERYPKLKLIAHHGGGMIPHFAGRLGSYLEDWGPKFDPAFHDCLQTLRKPLIEYFRMLYVDTALYQSPHSIHCVLEFFGTDHVLFGTDTPFDPERGSFVADAITAINTVQQDKRARNQIFEQNAIRLFGPKQLRQPM